MLVDKHHRYALSPTQLFWACWKRENVLVSRNLFQYGFRFFVTMFMVRLRHQPPLPVSHHMTYHRRKSHCASCLAVIISIRFAAIIATIGTQGKGRVDAPARGSTSVTSYPPCRRS